MYKYWCRNGLWICVSSLFIRSCTNSNLCNVYLGLCLLLMFNIVLRLGGRHSLFPCAPQRLADALFCCGRRSSCTTTGVTFCWTEPEAREEPMPEGLSFLGTQVDFWYCNLFLSFIYLLLWCKCFFTGVQTSASRNILSYILTVSTKVW